MLVVEQRLSCYSLIAVKSDITNEQTVRGLLKLAIAAVVDAPPPAPRPATTRYNLTGKTHCQSFLLCHRSVPLASLG